MRPQLLLTRVYAALAWLIAAIAVLHMATTWQLSSASAFTKVWFFGSGIAMAQTAALNLLHRTHDRTARSLAWVTRTSNALVLGFAAVAVSVTKASIAELVVILGTLAALLILSFTHRALRPEA